MRISRFFRNRSQLAVAVSLLATLFISSASATGEPARLDRVEPFRMAVQPDGSPRHIRIFGSNYENIFHPHRDEYMHWQIHRDDGSWQACADWNLLSAAGICHSTGWAPNEQVLEIGGNFVTREGFIELRVFHGLASDREIDPHRAVVSTEWSNVVRIPVVVPGPAPTIRSLSRSTFPMRGEPSEYQFIIDAGGLVGQPVVVFESRTVVWPERIYDGHNIQVTVPEPLRGSTRGELTVSVRTDKGGESLPARITFVDPPIFTVAPSGTRRVQTPAATATGITPTPPPVVGADAATPIPGATVGGPCIAGFVWREAAPADRVCVTPATRTLTARQNQEASTHRLPNNPNTCLQGFVWREAMVQDVVCVTPAERAQAAEDNRQALSRVAH